MSVAANEPRGARRVTVSIATLALAAGFVAVVWPVVAARGSSYTAVGIVPLLAVPFRVLTARPESPPASPRPAAVAVAGQH